MHLPSLQHTRNVLNKLSYKSNPRTSKKKTRKRKEAQVIFTYPSVHMPSDTIFEELFIQSKLKLDFI